MELKHIEIKMDEKNKRYKDDSREMIEKEINKNLKAIKDKIKDGASIPIEELNLSLRAYICLKHAGYNNVEEIANTTIDEIKRVRNLSEKNLEEIESKLKELGFSFKTEEHTL